MNKLKSLIKILPSFFLLLLLNSCFGGGGASNSGVDVKFLNNFTIPLVVEIWTGIPVRYVNGEVRGDKLKNNLVLQNVTNIGADNKAVVTISDDTRSVLVIIGTDEGVNGYWYLTDEVINNLDTYNNATNNYMVTVEIDASGSVTVY